MIRLEWEQCHTAKQQRVPVTSHHLAYSCPEKGTVGCSADIDLLGSNRRNRQRKRRNGTKRYHANILRLI